MGTKVTIKNEEWSIETHGIAGAQSVQQSNAEMSADGKAAYSKGFSAGSSKGHISCSLRDDEGAEIGKSSNRDGATALLSLVSKDTPTSTPVETTQSLSYDPAPGESGTIVYTFSGKFDPVSAYMQNGELDGALVQKGRLNLSGNGQVVITIPWEAVTV